MKAADAAAVSGDKAYDHISAIKPTAGNRRSVGHNKEQRRSKPTAASTVETVKRKISSEWDDCMHFLLHKHFYCIMIHLFVIQVQSYFVVLLMKIALLSKGSYL